VAEVLHVHYPEVAAVAAVEAAAVQLVQSQKHSLGDSEVAAVQTLALFFQCGGGAGTTHGGGCGGGCADGAIVKRWKGGGRAGRQRWSMRK
jgi:hypothetical protein